MRYSETYQETLPAIITVSQEEYAVGKEWIENVYTQVDTMSTSVMGSSFAENLSTSFGDNPPMKGPEAVEKLFAWQFSALKALEHVIESVLILQDRIIAQIQVNYTFLNGAQESVKCVSIFFKDIKGIKATEMHMYGDFSKSFSTFLAAAGPPSLA